MDERKEKFTPWPWHIRKPRKGHRICHSVLDKNGDGIAITVCRRHNGERVANDHLIEAGPDMYYALKDLMAALDFALSNAERVPDCIVAVAQDAMEKAEAAQKKARGEKC